MSIGIEIVGRPQFWITLDLPTVDALIKLSAAHYDARCVSASRLGGFLYGWKNNVTFAAEEGNDTSPCLASWDALDTSLKICEGLSPRMSSMSREEELLVISYRERARKAITAAAELSEQWRMKL